MTKSLDYDELAAEYARGRGVQPVLLAALLQRAALDADAWVAEIGCGTGNYIGAIAAATGCTCWGVEPSAAMSAPARARLSHVRFIQARGEDAALPAGRFDFIFSVDVIHHVADLDGFFRRVASALRPGGLLCTATDTPAMIARRAPLAAYFPGTVTADLVRYPTPARITHAMSAARLTSIEMTAVGHTFTLYDLTPYRDRAYSCLHLIDDAEFHAGLARMEADLARGPIRARIEYALLWAKRATDS